MTIPLIDVAESFVAGKYGDEARCEDGIVSTADHVALIDGATTEPGQEIDGRAPGRFAMEILAAAIRGFEPGVSAGVAVAELSQALARALAEHGEQPGRLASACVLIASARQREIWRVGNSTFVIDGTAHPQRWQLAEIPAQMRSAYLQALLRAGACGPEEIERDDPAQPLIAPLLRLEHVFRNAPDAGRLAYAAIDGRAIPAELIERAAIPPRAELVFASDGYPLAPGTLAEAERYLHESLAADPLRIHRHPEVRGLGPGRVSYDDRAYVRFSLP